MSRKKAFVIFPGRGAYQAEDLGYLKRFHHDKTEFLAMLEDIREQAGQKPLHALDGAKRFSLANHSSGENASLLIYACAMADFLSIDREQYEVVAVAGNSMGWYLSLAACGALSLEAGAQLVNTMGTLMHEHGVGGQILYPIVNSRWVVDAKAKQNVKKAIASAKKAGHQAAISIELGGTIVIAGDKAGLVHVKSKLPAVGEYPAQIARHAAFHTPLVSHVVPLAHQQLSPEMFTQPAIPAIDGTGTQWLADAADLNALYDYTLGTQITERYNFTRSVQTGLRDYAPDCIILPGPGGSMGAPVAQILIEENWWGLKSKADFTKMQTNQPRILSMGRQAQRDIVI